MKKKPGNASKDDADLDIPRVTRAELRRGVMGKYFDEYHGRGRNALVAVSLERDVAAVFKDSKSVNDVLRAIIRSMPKARTRKAG